MIRNAIFSQVSTAENVTIGGLTYARARFTQPLNGGKADLIGLELAWQQQFTRLPGLLSGLNLTPNLSVFGEGQNLTDEPTRQYQAGRRDWVIRQERYGRTFALGASFRW